MENNVFHLIASPRHQIQGSVRIGDFLSVQNPKERTKFTFEVILIVLLENILPMGQEFLGLSVVFGNKLDDERSSYLA